MKLRNRSFCGNHFGQVHGVDQTQRQNGEATLLRPGLLAAMLVLVSVVLACGGGQQANQRPFRQLGLPYLCPSSVP